MGSLCCDKLMMIAPGSWLRTDQEKHLFGTLSRTASMAELHLKTILFPGMRMLGQAEGLLASIDEVCLVAWIRARISLAHNTPCA